MQDEVAPNRTLWSGWYVGLTTGKARPYQGEGGKNVRAEVTVEGVVDIFGPPSQITEFGTLGQHPFGQRTLGQRTLGQQVHGGDIWPTDNFSLNLWPNFNSYFG